MEFRRIGQRVEPTPVVPFRSNNLPQVSASNRPQAMPQARPQAVPQVMPHAMPQVFPQVMPQAVPQVVPQDMSQALPQAVPVAVPIYPVLSIKSTAVRDKERLRLFVLLLTVRFLNECKALQKRDLKDWVPHTERLVNQTLGGLKLTEGYCPENSCIKRMCKAIIDELQRRFNSRNALQTEELDCPLVETIVVQCMQTHIQNESTRLAEAATASKACFIIKCLLLALVILGGVAVTVYLSVFWNK